MLKGDLISKVFFAKCSMATVACAPLQWLQKREKVAYFVENKLVIQLSNILKKKITLKFILDCVEK